VPVVNDGMRTRSLRIGPFDIQSSVRKRAPFELDLPYTRAMRAFGLFQHAPRDILIVGPGGGVIAGGLHTRAKALTTSPGLDLCRHVKRMEHHHRKDSVSGYPSSGEPAVEHDI